MESLPRKQTLPELVIARLREGITEGEWEGALPAERALSEKLEVSRSTLRLGISQLKDEGWLKVVGKRTMIVKRRKRTRANRGVVMKRRRIVFLSPIPLEQLPPMALFVYGELSRRLAALDATIQIEPSPALAKRKVEGYLDKLASGSRADAWVLYRSLPEVQRYFQSCATPAVLFGNAHEGISLPAMDTDYPAALKHCMSALIRLGHATDRIALVVPATRLAGNVEIETAFRAEAGTCILHDDGGSENACELLSRALSGARKPTAIIVLRTSTATTIHGLLQHRHSLSLPRDISLVCLEDAPFMEHLVPQMTRYHIDYAKIARLIFTTLSRQLSSGIKKKWSHRPLVPETIMGETLGKAREGD